MPGRMKYDAKTIQLAIELARDRDVKEAQKITGVNERTIRRWLLGDYQNARSSSKSELLNELSKFILTHGPEITVDRYGTLSKHSGEWKRHWQTWPQFRYEAACLAPLAPQYNKRLFLEVKEAIFLVGSDAHYWPYWGASAAHRALIQFAKVLKPTHIVLNGDVPDFPQITHHRPIAWKKEPTLREEMEEVHLRVGEIESSHSCERYWVWGNHDIRWDNRLAEKVPEFEDITGMSLRHHFPKWKFQNAIRINDTALEMKHRFRGGEMAVRHNVMRSGISYLSGHDHNRQIYRWRDAHGTRYGINPGLMASPWSPAFEYQENHIYNHDSGLAVITFENGKMCPPELIEVVTPDKVWFRGRFYEV